MKWTKWLIVFAFLIKFSDGSILCYVYSDMQTEDRGATTLLWNFDNDQIRLPSSSIVWVKRCDSCSGYEKVYGRKTSYAYNEYPDDV